MLGLEVGHLLLGLTLHLLLVHLLLELLLAWLCLDGVLSLCLSEVLRCGWRHLAVWGAVQLLLLLVQGLLLLLPDEHGAVLLWGQLHTIHVWRAHHIMGHDWCLCYSRSDRACVTHPGGWGDVMTHDRCCLLHTRRSVRHLRSTAPA